MKHRKKKLTGERTTVRIPDDLVEWIADLMDRTGWRQPAAVDFVLRAGAERIGNGEGWPTLDSLLKSTIAARQFREARVKKAVAAVDRDLAAAGEPAGEPEPKKRGRPPKDRGPQDTPGQTTMAHAPRHPSPGLEC